MADELKVVAAGGRVVSVDALRGFDMFWIIGGDELLPRLDDVFHHPVTGVIKEQLVHVTWEGFRFEDLIFPLFLFIIGLVMPYSISRRLERGEGRGLVMRHIVIRGLVLILLGLIYNGLLDFDFEKMRWVGVLQRIGLCYLIAGVIVMYTGWRGQAAFCVAFLVMYWAVMTFVPVPEFGAGVMTAEGCLSSYVDQLVIPGSLYYGFGDNEGALSTFPAVSTVLLGVLAGHWLRREKSGYLKAAGLAAAGLVCLAAGYAWSMQFPIIKNVWTSTFVLVAGGWSLLLLAAFYLVIDIWGFKRWAFFFIVIGMNPITIYMAQRIVNFEEISHFLFSGAIGLAPLAWQALLLMAAVLLIKWLFLLFLHRRRVFLRV